MLIQGNIKILFIIDILLLFEIIKANISEQSQNKAKKLIRNICENLFNNDLYSEEDKKWEIFCEKWFKTINHQQYNDTPSENIFDESHMIQSHQPRKISSGSRSSSSSRFRTSSSSRTSGSRISSLITRYRSTRTGASISRPTGWLWSRSGHVFLPISPHYYYRSYSSYNRYTTASTGSGNYYYCSSNSSIIMEIQCSTINGDEQCCENETTHQPFCCGGQIEDDFVEDFNQATRILARVFYILSIIALLMRRFYQ